MYKSFTLNANSSFIFITYLNINYKIHSVVLFISMCLILTYLLQILIIL